MRLYYPREVDGSLADRTQSWTTVVTWGTARDWHLAIEPPAPLGARGQLQNDLAATAKASTSQHTMSTLSPPPATQHQFSMLPAPADSR